MGFDWNVDAAAPADDVTETPTAAEALESLVASPTEQAAPEVAFRSRREARAALETKPARAPKAQRVPKTQRAAKPARAPKARAAKPAETTRAVTGRRPKRAANPRRIVSKSLTVAAMLGAGGLLVATSLPANALINPDATAAVSQAHVVTQKLAVDSQAPAAIAARDPYTVVTAAEQRAMSWSTPNFAYTNDPNGTIQWPFLVTVPISSGFGPRHVAGCGFCSTFHEGIDFDPGLGAPVHVITAGVVSQVIQSHAGLGNHVVVDHVINGQKIQSVYGHMLDGSIDVTVGQTLKVNDVVGLTGSTGASTGPHMHLEIHVDGVPVDPFAWMKANAN